MRRTRSGGPGGPDEVGEVEVEVGGRGKVSGKVGVRDEVGGEVGGLLLLLPRQRSA